MTVALRRIRNLYLLIELLPVSWTPRRLDQLYKESPAEAGLKKREDFLNRA